jgi:hypothetical protein
MQGCGYLSRLFQHRVDNSPPSAIPAPIQERSGNPLLESDKSSSSRACVFIFVWSLFGADCDPELMVGWGLEPAGVKDLADERLSVTAWAAAFG